MRYNRLLILFIVLLVFSVNQIFASSGKISGVVIDKDTGEPLPFANVFIDGTTMGAATDLEGNFVILNVPPGVYTVTASIVGYQKQAITDVRVNVDFTTRLEFELSTGSIDLPAVIVQGERNPLIRQDLTNPTVAITSETIDELPVNQISEVIRLQAGVVTGNDGDLHFRGGYGNEVAYTLNGVTLNDPYGNRSSIGLATNAVQEVSVSTGTFSAEYGNALSGVVNYVTKEGSDKYSGSLRGYMGDYLTDRKELFQNIDDIDPLNRARGEFTLGGPIPLINNAKFFISGVYENYKGYLYGIRLYNPSDSYLALGEFPEGDSRKGASTDPWYFNPYGTDSTGLPTGDGGFVPMNDRSDINFQANLSYQFTPTLKLKYEFVLDNSEARGGGGLGFFEAKYVPDSRGKTYTDAYHNALEFTHTVSQNVFYTLKGSYTQNEGEYYLYDNVEDPRYLPSQIYQRTITNTSFLTGGTDNLRFFRKTKTVGFKGDMVAQLWTVHEIRAGFEGRFFDMNVESYNVEIGKYDPASPDNFGSLNTNDMFDPNLQILRRVPSDTSLYTNYTRKPTLMGVYLRDKIELAASSLILNVGLRYDYFDPAADYNPNINSEFETDLQGSLTKGTEKAEVKHMVSPRFSVSYPITDQGIIRFSYGHFYQNGSLSSLYSNPYYYSVLGSNPSFGNPDVEPQKSIQYELGLTQGLTEDLRLELTGFYKDVTNYIQQQTVFTPSGKEFSLLSNLAYSNVRGITVSLFKRRSPQSLFQGSLDYTFTIAEGNRTEPAEDLFFSEVTNKLAEVYLVPLSFDRQHVINASVNLIQPEDWTLGLTGYFQTGTPYTPAFPSQVVAITFEQSSANRPTNWNVNLKFEKYFDLGPLKTSLFLQVDNLFDTENEVYVYASSGRALSNVEETVNANLLDNIRSRINRGDPGLFGIEQVDQFYSQRPQNVNRPREVLLGFTVLF